MSDIVPNCLIVLFYNKKTNFWLIFTTRFNVGPISSQHAGCRIDIGPKSVLYRSDINDVGWILTRVILLPGQPESVSSWTERDWLLQSSNNHVIWVCRNPVVTNRICNLCISVYIVPMTRKKDFTQHWQLRFKITLWNITGLAQSVECPRLSLNVEFLTSAEPLMISRHILDHMFFWNTLVCEYSVHADSTYSTIKLQLMHCIIIYSNPINNTLFSHSVRLFIFTTEFLRQPQQPLCGAEFCRPVRGVLHGGELCHIEFRVFVCEWWPHALNTGRVCVIRLHHSHDLHARATADVLHPLTHLARVLQVHALVHGVAVHWKTTFAFDTPWR